MAKETAPTPAKPSYQALPLSALPKRVPPTRGGYDEEAARGLLAVISADFDTEKGETQPTATDATAYADQKIARAEANKAKRLVSHVLPEGKAVKTAIFGLAADGKTPVTAAESAGKYGWALWLIDAPAETPAAES